jgi:hypothetical protein
MMKTKTRRFWISTLIAFFVAAFIGSCKDDNVATVELCPAVISTNPINAATGVPLNQTITVTFNEKMNPATITAASFTLQGAASTKSKILKSGMISRSSLSVQQVASNISGTISYSGVTATFQPDSALMTNTTYTGTVTSAVKDLHGNILQINYVWTFSTGATLAPTVLSTDPIDSATSVVLNKVITASFSMPMDPLTITTSTFTLKNGAISVAGIVAYSGTTASFTPSASLISGTTYTATITTGAKNISDTSLVNNHVWTFTTGTLVAPTVLSTDPINLATNVVLNKIITATFSVPMDPTTLTASTFTLKAGATVVSGTVSYSGSIATFTPASALLTGTTYTATLTTGIKNVAGTPLVNNNIWTFSTGATILPTVTLTDPLNLATNIAINKIITATFSVPMDPLTITTSTFTLKAGATNISGVVTYSGNTATFTTSSSLLPGTTYTATITTGAKNVPGSALAVNYVWTFSTNAVVVPTVTSTNPLNASTGVALNKIVAASFSTAMDPTTITTSTFTLKAGATVIAGAVSYSGTTASFTPTSNLISGTIYTATITSGVKNISGTPLASNYVWTFTTIVVIPPTVLSTDPLNLATNVVLNKIITANFSVPMDPSTITTSNFIVKAGATVITGAVTYSGTTATFTPGSALLTGTTYTVTLTTAIKNVAGIPLINNNIWTFSTGAVIVPTVTSTDPLNAATGVALNKIVSASFSVGMDPSTITTSTFTLKAGATVIAGIVSYLGTTASFTPTSNLLSGTVYTATITTGAKNVAGTPLAINNVWTFTTLVVPPTILSTDPLNLATSIALNKVVSATFSVPMDPLTITTSSFTLKLGVVSVAGSVNYSGSTATFTPTALLISDSTYTATITTLAKNVGGTPLASNYVWKFNTVAHLGPIAVNLNSVARFGIIAGVGVSNNAGPSVINNMDVGISPGALTSVTGFPPATIVNGAIYAADAGGAVTAMLIQAQTDLTNAYNFAAAATLPAPALAPSDLGGKTLAPGIYYSTSTMLLQNGNLTLDAQGDINAVWIFQVGSSFTSVGISPYPSSTGGNVILSGGAQAKNVFWQISSSATIGDYTSFYGNILAFSSITMNSHSTITGRVLARNASVIMTSTNTISKP